MGKEERENIARLAGGIRKYFRPHDLLEAAYASCLNIAAGMALDSMKLSFEKVTVQVGLDRSDETRAVFRYRIDISGSMDEEVCRNRL